MADRNLFDWRDRHWKERAAMLVLGVALLIVFGPDLWELVKRRRDDVRSIVRDSVSVEVELQRARRMVDDVLPEFRRNREAVVHVQVELEELEREVKQQERELERQRRELLHLQAQARNVPRAGWNAPDFVSLVNEISHRFEMYQRQDAKVATDRQRVDLLRRHVSQVEAAQRESVHRLRELMAEVEHLESRVRLLNARRQSERPAASPEQLAACDEQIAYLRRRLSVAERLAAGDDWQESLTGGVAMNAVDSRSYILDEVDSYFAERDSRTFTSAASEASEKLAE